MSPRTAFPALLLFAIACSSTSLLPRRAIVPQVDHHQHVLGPAALPPKVLPLPPVSVPTEIERLLLDRAKLNANAKTAADLHAVFTNDAQALLWSRPSRWVRGEEAMVEIANQVAPLAFRYVPNAFEISDDLGYVAGTVAVGEGDAAVHALDFLLALKREGDGIWRIAAETTSIKSAPLYSAPITADKVVADLDDAGIRNAIVLSVAFWKSEYEEARAENDWTAAEVARHPDRLAMACSVNVLKDFAIQELERCARIPQSRAFKIHFGDSNVDFANAVHMEQVRRFLEAANDHRVPLIIHLAPRTPYGPAEVEIFLSLIASVASDIPIQIAHLAGDGPGLTSPEATAAFAERRAAGDPRTRNLYFDIGGLVTAKTDAKHAELIAMRIRQIGLKHVLYGSDGQPPNAPTAEHWTQVVRKLPLTDDELRTIAANVAPYMSPTPSSRR